MQKMMYVVSHFELAADKKGGPSQILRCPITKLVLVMKSNLDSLTDGAIAKWTKWELFCGEPDEAVWYELTVI